MNSSQPIGVFDSGVGGLTFVKAFRELAPDEQIIYLGDTARVPYGAKSEETVRRYATQTCNFLLKQDVKYIVVACNTASAYAVQYLRNSLEVPVMGVIGPGAFAATQSSHSGKIGVLGTLGTVSSGAYQKAIKTLRSDAETFAQACPLLVPLAEEGWLDHPVTEQVVKHYLLALREKSTKIDTIILGCTHYPLLKPLIARVAHGVFQHAVTLIDSAEATAREVIDDLVKHGMKGAQARTSTGHFYFTDVSRAADQGQLFLGVPLPHAELVDL